MAKVKTKEEALKILTSLDEDVVMRLAELATNKKALGYFKSPIQFAMVKGFLK